MKKKKIKIEFRGYTYTTYQGFFKALKSGRWEDVNTQLTYDALRCRLTNGYTPEEAVTKKLKPGTTLSRSEKWKPVTSHLTKRWTSDIRIIGSI